MRSPTRPRISRCANYQLRPSCPPWPVPRWRLPSCRGCYRRCWPPGRGPMRWPRPRGWGPAERQRGRCRWPTPTAQAAGQACAAWPKRRCRFGPGARRARASLRSAPRTARSSIWRSSSASPSWRPPHWCACTRNVSPAICWAACAATAAASCAATGSAASPRKAHRRAAVSGAGGTRHLPGVEQAARLCAAGPPELDTLDANRALGWGRQATSARFLTAATMLESLGIKRVRLLTNNPNKLAALAACGVEIVGREAHAFAPNGVNDQYLATKAERFGHLLGEVANSRCPAHGRPFRQSSIATGRLVLAGQVFRAALGRGGVRGAWTSRSATGARLPAGVPAAAPGAVPRGSRAAAGMRGADRAAGP